MYRILSRVLFMVLAVAPVAPVWAQSRARDLDERLEQVRRAELLERFRRASPQARWQLLEKVGKPAWHTVAKDDVVAEIVERGSVEAVLATDVVCRLTTGDIMIAWVIDDGAIVKRGDKILEFDDRHLRERLKKQRLESNVAVAHKEQAARELALVEREGKLASREAEADIAAAEREAKAYKGTDPVKKEVLELRVERARVGLERAKVGGQSRLLQAEAELRAKSNLAEQEQLRLQALDYELRLCVVTAPRDGIVVYHVPETRRFGASPGALVAVGEPVRPRQKLLRVVDLRQAAVRIHIPEAQVARGRRNMPATVRVDAFPNQTFTGKVAAIASAAAQEPWLARDIKTYPALIHLDGEQTRLKPGMSAEGRILLERRDDVLTIPPQAILAAGKERYCYVRAGKDKVEARTLVLGVHGNRAVEVREGLKVGDQVLADPVTVISRLEAILPPRSDDSRN